MEKAASVVDIKKRNRSRKKQSDDLGFSEIRHHVARAMDYEKIPSGWPDFPAKFHKMVDPIGKEFFLEENDNKIVKFISKHLPPQLILTYVIDMVPDELRFEMKKKDADEIFYYWHSQKGQMIEKPLYIAEKNDPRLAFARLPFDFGELKIGIPAPPFFEEFLSRCSARRALAAFIGSLFFEESYMQQYLYIKGEGQDGKGSIINVLRNILGDGYQTISPRLSSDRFWFMKTYGKRLCVAPDLGLRDSEDFLVSPELKALTGGDPIFYEGKAENGFTDSSISKIIIASNFDPKISGQKSDTRRLIYCYVSAPEEKEFDVSKYRDDLMSEARQIIEHCISVYLEDCPGHGMIKTDTPEEIISSSEEKYIAIFEKYFHVDEGSKIKAQDVLERIHGSGIRSGIEIREIKSCWERRFKINFKKTGEGLFYQNLRMTIKSSDGQELVKG